MAQPSTISGPQLLIKIESAPDSGVFNHPCLINSARGIAFSADANQEVVPDCDNPDDPGWKLVTKDGMAAAVTGAGKLDTGSIPLMDAWFRVDEPKNVRVYVAAVGYWEGAFKLTEWSITGDRAARAECSLTLVSDGPVLAFNSA